MIFGRIEYNSGPFAVSVSLLAPPLTNDHSHENERSRGARRLGTWTKPCWGSVSKLGVPRDPSKGKGLQGYALWVRGVACKVSEIWGIVGTSGIHRDDKRMGGFRVEV